MQSTALATLLLLPGVLMTSVEINGITDTLKPEDEKYAEALKTVAKTFDEAKNLFSDEDFIARIGWKNEGECEDGEIIYARNTPAGKILTVSTVLQSNVDEVMEETWKGMKGLPDWNPNIKFASYIASPTEHFDVVTYGNNDVLIVSGRDFVSARLYRPLPEGGYMMVSRSVELPDVPEVKGKVRADLKLAAARFRPHPTESDKTLCEVVMQVDLKGLLPKIVVNQAMSKIMAMDTDQNKKHFEKLYEKNHPKA